MSVFLQHEQERQPTRNKFQTVFSWICKERTSSILKLGSGEMTVRLEKSTRLPERFPRKRPCLPFNLWTKPLVNFFGYKTKSQMTDDTKTGTGEVSKPAVPKELLTFRCWCREHTATVGSPSPPANWHTNSSLDQQSEDKNQFTMIICILAPDERCFRMTSFKNKISDSFTVRSSSLLKQKWHIKRSQAIIPSAYVPAESAATDGLMHAGGTRRRVRIRLAGWPSASLFIPKRGMS